MDDLALLQDRIKREPTLYKDEFIRIYNSFPSLLLKIKNEPAKPAIETCQVLLFLSHVSHVFPNECSFLREEVISTLE